MQKRTLMARLWAEIENLVVLAETLCEAGGIPIDLDTQVVTKQEGLGLVERRTH